MLVRYFEFIPICPEVEVGMGVPRESVRLAGDPERPHMVGFKSGKDWTYQMRRFCKRRTKDLAEYNLSGYILKAKSPSCGIARVRLRTLAGRATHRLTVGLYAREVSEQYPLLPVEDEGRLNDAGLRENFIVRVFAYDRLQRLFRGSFKRSEAIRFHTGHKYLILAHDPRRYSELGRLVAAIKQLRPTEFAERYSRIFMNALKMKATVRKNVNVMMHMVGFFKKHIESSDKTYLLRIIEDYHKGLVPLIVPITLIRHYVQKFDIEYLADQVYIDPHPKELMLRNHT
jgi:uncharacterized protein YbgA (DUF1722 family)/uncharacterized protein YbbK (DUF523 family)